MRKARHDIKPDGANRLSYYYGHSARRPPDDLVEKCQTWVVLQNYKRRLLGFLIGLSIPPVIVALVRHL